MTCEDLTGACATCESNLDVLDDGTCGCDSNMMKVLSGNSCVTVTCENDQYWPSTESTIC
jgi:hypothetical protein